MTVARPSGKEQTAEAVAQLRSVAKFIDRSAERLVGETGDEPIAEGGMTLAVELRHDGLPTVTAHKTYIVPPRP